jgi:hypothetical protein
MEDESIGHPNNIGIRRIVSINPKFLTDLQIIKVHQLIQDIWADGTGEFVSCDHCHRVHSKSEIFSSLSKAEYQKNVAEILKEL